MKDLWQFPDEDPDPGVSRTDVAIADPISWSDFLTTKPELFALNLGNIESTLSGVLADSCSNIVDEIAELDRAEARQQAWKIERIDEARRAAEATLHGVRVLGSDLSAAKQQEMAFRSLVSELACALRVPEGTVIGMIADADALMHRLPATMAALRAGTISYRHAKVMVEQTATLSAEAALALEEQAVPFATTVTVAKFRAKTRLLRESLDPESIAARVAKSATDRRLEFEPANDGMAWLSLYTTAPEATSIYTAVRDYAHSAQTPDDPRTLTQLTADVFTDAVSAALSRDLTDNDDPRSASGGSGADTDLVTTPAAGTTEAGAGERPAPASSGAGERPARASTRTSSRSRPGSGSNPDSGSGSVSDTGADTGADLDVSGAARPRMRFGSGSAFRRIQPTVTVTVPALTLLGVSDDPAILDGYGPIDADTARALAGQSDTWYRMLTDPKTGAPIAMDRTKYRPTRKMKRYLRYRDGTCRFPGCNRAARHCDLDHTNDHDHGGPTECENLAHLCRKHHRLKHHTTWKVRQHGAGILEWTSPGGRRYTTQPDVLLTADMPATPPDRADPPAPIPPPPNPDEAPPF